MYDTQTIFIRWAYQRATGRHPVGIVHGISWYLGENHGDYSALVARMRDHGSLVDTGGGF